ncbi:MAG: hypothetical protein WBD28_00770 [Candidatus Zixiibacteriota bacterium]
MKFLDSFWKKNPFLILAYLFVNFLFVYKYSARITSLYLTLSLLYSVMVVLVIEFMLRKRETFRVLNKQTIYLPIVILLAVLYAVAMFHIDPFGTRVGRYPALYTFIHRLLSGDFPYVPGQNISGFPFLFFLLIPFYLIGDLGLFQICSFVIFSIIVHKKYAKEKASYIPLFLLVLSPAFLYEVMVRSELFSNMVFIVFLFYILERVKPIKSTKALFFSGILAGFLLSTRGIVLLPYLIFFIFYFKKDIKSLIFFGLSAALGFMITFVPFLLWNKELFFTNNPLTIQKSYIPNLLLFISVLLCILLAISADTFKKVYFSTTKVLFVVVLLCFILNIYHASFKQGVLVSFDISYFCFCLPYLLLSFEFRKNSSPVKNRRLSENL